MRASMHNSGRAEPFCHPEQSEGSPDRRTPWRFLASLGMTILRKRVVGYVVASRLFGVLALCSGVCWPALAAPAEPSAALTWSNVTAVLSSTPGTGRQRDVDEAGLIGKTVSLSLQFVAAERDLEGGTRYLYEHTEPGYVFKVYVRGVAANKGSGEVTGRLTRVAFAQADLRGTRVYFLWLDADILKRFPGQAAAGGK